MSDGYSNFAFLVSDPLRYDYVPDGVEEKKIPTLTSSLHIPISFASIFSGRVSFEKDQIGTTKKNKEIIL